VICEAGQVAIVPFPFVDQTVSKVRPAVVLSSRVFNEENGSTVLAMITTAKRSAWPSDIPLKDVEAAGLRQGCYVRWKVFTLSNDILHRTAGILSRRDFRAVQTAARRLLG
jgi:mRNA interferase MazF